MGTAKSGKGEKMRLKKAAGRGSGTKAGTAGMSEGKKAKRADQPEPRKGRKPSLGEKQSVPRGNTSIKRTLTGAFLVPIVLIIILGVVSYMTASDTSPADTLSPYTSIFRAGKEAGLSTAAPSSAKKP